ncbi:GNAT family N-acetyltransferase [Chryseolinea sp. T2]|uniref:GNAT family N-acetyltransferase n=1 Tax=Chryseolinea sp. T2 TaxID=3129255 RepID=UPI003077B3E9
MSILIQKANHEHLHVLVEMQQRLASETEHVYLPTETVTKGMTALFDDPGKGEYYVASDGKEAVGCFLITYEWSDWRNGMVWWLQSVYVHESARKSGVFKKMFEYVMTAIEQNPGIIGLRLYVDKTNERAMKVYEAMGMDGSHYTVYEKMKVL